MKQILQYKKFDAVIMCGLIALWLLAFKSSILFNFFETYSSLWYLPAGVTLSIALAVPLRFIVAPLFANWLLAVPLVSTLLDVEYTSVADHLLHGSRLFVVYAGAGCLLRYLFKIKLPVSNLSDQLKVIVVTLLAAVMGAVSGVSLHVGMGSFDWSVAREIVLPWMIGDGIAAVIVPPLLVPLLVRLFAPDHKRVLQRNLSSIQMLLFQFLVILITMVVAYSISQNSSGPIDLWYVVVLPPILFSVRGGIPNAASAIAITALLTPPVATFMGFDGELISLQLLLIIGGVFSLMIGGAITDRNNVIELVKRHELDLENQIAIRTDQLQKAYRFQQHLIRSIGHDVRQPLYAINHMVAGMSIANKDPKLKRPLQQTKLMGETALNITQRILDYAKREAGKVEVVNEKFAIQNVFDQIAGMYEFERTNKKVQLSIQPTNLELMSDEHLVLEAVSNLIQNSIRLSKTDDIVELSVIETDSGIVIIVTDQVTSIDDPSGEAGFGLEIVRQISQLLNVDHIFEPNLSKLNFK